MIKLMPLHPDPDGFRRNLRREGTPERVFYFEHGIADNVQQAIAERHGLWQDIDDASEQAGHDRRARLHRFLGHELFPVYLPGARIMSPSQGGWVNSASGLVAGRAELERLRLPRPEEADLSVLDYYEKSLPQDMRVFHVITFWEVVRDSMGFENLCLNLYDDPGLVEEMFSLLGVFVLNIIETCCDYDCYGAVYLADDLGYKSSLMLSPTDVRRLILPWHKRFVEAAHNKGKIFFLHSCGQMYDLMDEYIDDIGIDAKHSFEDVVLPVTEAKQLYGDRLTLLGGLDVDMLARATEKEIRQRTRQVLDICQPGGGYFLGSGNWVTSYIPLDNYLAMLDEARRWTG